MKRRLLIALVALVPAALNTAPAAARGLAVPLCGGDGGPRTITLPLPAGEIPGKEAPGCCAKGCHTGSRRKSQSGQIDTGQ